MRAAGEQGRRASIGGNASGDETDASWIADTALPQLRPALLAGELYPPGRPVETSFTWGLRVGAGAGAGSAWPEAREPLVILLPLFIEWYAYTVCSSRPATPACHPAPSLALVTGTCHCRRPELSFSHSHSHSHSRAASWASRPPALFLSVSSQLPRPIGARALACLHTSTHVLTAFGPPKPERASLVPPYPRIYIRNPQGGRRWVGKRRRGQTTRSHRQRERKRERDRAPWSRRAVSRQPAIDPARSVPRARGPCNLRASETQPSFAWYGYSTTLGDGCCSRAAASPAALCLQRYLLSPRAAAAAAEAAAAAASACRPGHRTPAQCPCRAASRGVVTCVAGQACCRRRCCCRGRCCCHGRCCRHGRCHDRCGSSCHRYHAEAGRTTHDDGAHPRNTPARRTRPSHAL